MFIERNENKARYVLKLMYCLILFCSCKSFGKFISIPSTKLYLITNHQLSELGKNTVSEPSLDGVAGEYETEFINVL